MPRIFRITALFLILCTLLSACGGSPSESTAPAETPAAASSEAETHLQTEEGWSVVTVHGVEMLWDGSRVKDQYADLDIDAMHFSDFGEDLFTETYPVETERYVLCPGEITEAEVLHIRGAEEGPVIYIVAGVHESVVERTYGLAKRAGIKPVVAMTGGVALNDALRERLENRIGHPIATTDDAQFVGAYGAALFALG